MIPQVKPWLGKEEARAVMDVVESGWLTEGSKAREFSSRLNELIGVEHGVFAPNGTLSLYLGLLALGIGPGDEVLVPDTTFIASANAVYLTGAVPVFVGVNDYNYQIDVSRCSITDRTRAIMPVHLYGMSANMTQVMEFAQSHNLLVIEDAAEAIGVYYKGQHAGSFGDVGCFSFFADKTITTGEGGYVVCRDAAIYDRLLHLRNQGRIESGTFQHPQIGYNFRITDLQAAIGLVQLDRLPDIKRCKKTILGQYFDELKNIEEVRFLEIEPGSTYVPFRVVLICERAQDLMAYLKEHKVQSRTFFYPLHRQPCFSYMGLKDSQFPNAVYGFEHGICLPVFPTMWSAQVEYICGCVKEFYRGKV